MPRYFLRVSLEHLSFRIPSLLSIAKQFNFDITLVSEDLERGVLIIDLEKEEYLNHLLDRATLIM
jgi:tRNA (guanine10-N2)-methyltransferase